MGENQGSISASYATGAVSGSTDVGGLVGYNAGNVSDTYATGAVSGSSNVGGLVGDNESTVNTSYAAGTVSGGFPTGGFAGLNNGTISDGYWLSGTSTGIGGGTVAGATQLSSPGEYLASSYAGFTFGSSGPWYNVDGYTTPFLTAFAAKTADGGLNSLGDPYIVTNAFQLELVAANPSGYYALGTSISLAGTALASLGGVWGSAGFGPIGTLPNGSTTYAFAGSFNGNSGSGYTIDGLTITAADNAKYVGLFGDVGGGGSVSNVTLTNVTVSAGSSSNYIGGLVAGTPARQQRLRGAARSAATATAPTSAGWWGTTIQAPPAAASSATRPPPQR